MSFKPFKYTLLAACCGTALLLPFLSFAETAPANKTKRTEIHFSADQVEENSETKVITATGNVNILRQGTSLKADKIVYDRKNDIITAVGNVSIVQPDGTTVFADDAQLEDKMSKGTVHEVKMILADESRVAARRIKQSENKNKYFFYGVYSPCDICQENPSPLWQIKAKKITHDAAAKDVYYQDAFIQIKDIPVFYTPFMSHPDPTVKRRSGLLPPTMRSTSYLGTAIEIPYFWNISDHEDLTFSPILSTDQGIIPGGSYRKMFYNGDLSVSGTYMKDKDTDEKRYNLFMKGRYEINDFWLANMDINYASDGSYLKDMSLPGKTETWLTSNIAFERFDGRDYAAIEAYSYKLVSYSLREYHLSEFEARDYSKPYILPLITYENISEPYSNGAYFKNTVSMASVYRERDETNTQRATMINSWNLPYTSPYGEKYKFVASVKSDLYYVDKYINNQDDTYTGSVGRIFPQAGVEWRLPFVKATETSRQIIEPVIVAVAAPNGGNKINKIPNEDSLNAQLDDTNILNLDRYDGYDRNDTGSRISYGINWSSYGNVIGRTSMFIAQSYYFEKDESFSESLGDNSHLSDYVGRIYASPSSYLDLNYRFRIDRSNFEFKYNEVNARIGTDILSAYIAFTSINGRNDNRADSGLYFFDDYRERKELYTSVQAKISRDWRITAYNRQDLTADSDGSLEHGGELIYEDECFKLIFNIHKYNSTDPDYDDSYEYSATFLLKTLGGIGSN